MVDADVVLYGSIGSLLDGLLVGSLYGLMALGLTLIFRVTKIANFAYAEYITYAGYAAFAASLLSTSGAAAFALAALAAAVVGALASLLSDLGAFRPLWRRGADSLTLLVASMGVGFVMRYSLLGAAVSLNWPLQVQPNVENGVLATIGGLSYVSYAHVAAVLAAVITAAAMHLLFTRTRTGKAMRATASNPTLARISGINIDYIRSLTWLLAGMIGGIAGFLYSYYNPLNPESGWQMLLWIFAAAIMGGFTFYGALVSGVILGLAEALIAFYLNLFFGIDTAYSPVIALFALVLVLLFKPEGVLRLEAHSLRRRV
jgi:branched-subunit amino acid ABC-type transport system permease component